MDAERISRLAIEMLKEIAKDGVEPEAELMFKMLEQRLKPTLVWAKTKTHDHMNSYDQGTEAIQHLY